MCGLIAATKAEAVASKQREQQNPREPAAAHAAETVATLGSRADIGKAIVFHTHCFFFLSFIL